MNEITKPWVIIHQLDDGIETILAGPQGATMPSFALCAADLIRHTARRFFVSEAEVFKRVTQELRQPTTDITEQHLSEKH